MTNVNELGKMGIRETPFFIKKGVSRALPPKNFYSEGIFVARSATKMPSDTAFLWRVREPFCSREQKGSRLSIKPFPQRRRSGRRVHDLASNRKPE